MNGYTFSHNLYNITWQLTRDIARTANEIAAMSLTYAQRDAATAKLMWQIDRVVNDCEQVYWSETLKAYVTIPE